jgi:hypothetical protein
MPLKLHPTGLGVGIDKDGPDYTGRWEVGRIYQTRGGHDTALVLVANRQWSDDALGPSNFPSPPSSSATAQPSSYLARTRSLFWGEPKPCKLFYNRAVEMLKRPTGGLQKPIPPEWVEGPGGLVAFGLTSERVRPLDI